jgi:hypothetical protein
MRKTVGTCVIIWAVSLCATALAQTNLNAPVSRQPTIKTEIDRGQDAAFNCGLDNLTNFSKFVDCIDAGIAANRQNSSLSEPYEFGLCIRALQHAYVQGRQLGSDGNLTVWRDRLVKIMMSRKLTLADFCKAVPGIKCDLATMNEQTYGSGTAATQPAR